MMRYSPRHTAPKTIILGILYTLLNYSHLTNKKMNQFKNGLFDCQTNCCTFITSVVLPCVVYGKTQAKMKDDEGCCILSVMYWISMIMFCDCCMGAYGRTMLRKRYHIEGSCVNDVAVHLCCSPCALTQEYSEISSMEVSHSYP
ncbi:PLAC8 family-domain-containing protein [Globomyces pollinis-pini]|nr:PLAC8 family-domain-containing protein [Globomyces pollinis-pini]